MNIRYIIKRLFGINPKDTMTLDAFLRSWYHRIGRIVCRRPFTPEELVEALQRAGMKRGDTVLMQSSWREFYNFTGTPKDFIDAVVDALGPEGTLCMACMPIVKPGQTFDIAHSPTSAGYLAETFRNYPGVKRSINERHSVCALGPNADFLLGEHHLGETPWDEKSPYYKLAVLDGLTVTLGMGHYWFNTVAHCVESILKDEVPYYSDMWDKEKTRYDYIDYDGQQGHYFNYSMPERGSKMRVASYLKGRHIMLRYLPHHYQHISNLQILTIKAQDMVTTLTALARRGIDIYMLPLKWGYEFEK